MAIALVAGHDAAGHAHNEVMGMLDRLGFIDVGARGGTAAALAQYHDRLDRVLVEPEAAEFERLRAESGDGTRFKVIGTALGHVDGQLRLFQTVNPTCSSALPVNHDLVDQYSIHSHFAASTEATIPCSRYDTLFAKGGLPAPHIIKVDVQGFEYQVLQGFGALLQTCMAIELETHFYELYRGQKRFGDLVAFLETYGFVLRKLGNARSPMLNGDYHFDGDLVEVDATFTKNKKWVLAHQGRDHPDFDLSCSVVGVASYA